MSKKKNHKEPSRFDGDKALDRRLAATISGLGVAEPERECYLCFAREFALCLRRAKAQDLPRRAKLVAARWFRRGLSGRVLWLLGRAVMRERGWQV